MDRPLVRRSRCAPGGARRVSRRRRLVPPGPPGQRAVPRDGGRAPFGAGPAATDRVRAAPAHCRNRVVDLAPRRTNGRSHVHARARRHLRDDGRSELRHTVGALHLPRARSDGRSIDPPRRRPAASTRRRDRDQLPPRSRRAGRRLDGRAWPAVRPRADARGSGLGARVARPGRAGRGVGRARRSAVPRRGRPDRRDIGPHVARRDGAVRIRARADRTDRVRRRHLRADPTVRRCRVGVVPVRRRDASERRRVDDHPDQTDRTRPLPGDESASRDRRSRRRVDRTRSRSDPATAP